MGNHPADFSRVRIAHRIKGAVEFVKETADHAFRDGGIIRLEEHPAERWCQSQCDKGRNRHGYRDGDRKLLVEDTHRPAEESDRDENGSQHRSRRDDRSLHLIHRLFCGLLHRHMVFGHMLLHVFDDNDRIIDDHADGKHQRKKRQCIDGEAEHDEGRKRTDDGDRHRKDRDEGRAPFLQKYKDDQNDKEQRFDEGIDHFGNRCIDKSRVIDDDLVLQIRREIILRFREDLFHRRDRFERIRIIRQLHAKADPRLAVELRVC